MSFTLSEFILESLIRNEVKRIQENAEIDFIINDIFGNLTSDLLKNKYGQLEIEKLKNYILENQIQIYHALPVSSDSLMPSFSIHLQSDLEDESLEALSSFEGVEDKLIEIEPEVIVDNFNATSYCPKNGKITVGNSTNLERVDLNRWLNTSDGLEYQIIRPVSNEENNKYFYIDNHPTTLNLTGLKIVSAIESRIFKVRMIPCRETILIGVHSENGLLTKFLYHFLKYVLYRNVENLASKNIQLAKYSGSDFSQLNQYLPDNVYSRFISCEFISYNSYSHEEISQIDSVVDKNIYVEVDNSLVDICDC